MPLQLIAADWIFLVGPLITLVVLGSIVVLVMRIISSLNRAKALGKALQTAAVGLGTDDWAACEITHSALGGQLVVEAAKQKNLGVHVRRGFFKMTRSERRKDSRETFNVNELNLQGLAQVIRQFGRPSQVDIKVVNSRPTATITSGRVDHSGKQEVVDVTEQVFGGSV